MSFELNWHGAQEAQAAFDQVVVRANMGSRLGIQRLARMAEAAMKERTPVLTGTLRRSIHVEGPEPVGSGWMAQVGPSELYGRRVELGFSGTDSLGRTYNQSGHPYVEPGVLAILPQAPAVMAAAWREAMGL